MTAGSGSIGELEKPLLSHIVPFAVTECVCPTMPEPFTQFTAARVKPDVRCELKSEIATPVTGVSIGGAAATSLLKA